MHAGYIDGAYVTGEGRELLVENPSDGSQVARLPGLSLPQMEAAATAARRSFRAGDWSGLPKSDRCGLLRALIDAVERRGDEVMSVLAAETGCPPHAGVFAAQFVTPLRMAREILDLVESLPSVEEIDLPAHEATNQRGQRVRSLRRYSPLGVVLGISAYNFPLHTGVWKVFPALAAGNSVILRPNPLTPLSSMALVDAAHEVGLPPGVLNVVLEAGAEGAQLLSSHADVDLVTFTGSSSVGAQVAVQAAATLKRVQLELGGKSAQIFLDSADRAVAAATSVFTSHAGQGCVLGTRILVPDAVKADVVARTAAAAAGLVVGRSADPATQVGPVISEAQVARCERFVRLACENGGRVAAGGRRPPGLDGGYFFEPTVLDLPDNSNPAAQEEIFGPVVAFIGYRDVAHAIEMANDSRYGLSGYVFGEDVGEAMSVAERVHSGAVHVNGALSSTFVAFGGIKASGLGVERGEEGMRLFERLTVHSVTQ